MHDQPAFDGKGKMIDYVSAPPHYKALKPEPIEVIEAWALEAHEANVLKYLARARFKGDELGDLKKAAWYIQRKIALIEKTRAEHHALRGDGSIPPMVAEIDSRSSTVTSTFSELMDEARKLKA